MDLNEAVAARMHLLQPAKALEAQAQHDAFLERFPREAWRSMSLEDYALGTERTRESYSYALEWGTTSLGSIRGGTSAKHVIFQRRKTAAWHFPSGYPSVQQAWLSLRGAFETALELAQAGRWSEIANVSPLSTAKVVKLKTLYLYNSQEVLPVYSGDHLRYYASQLGVDPDPDLVGLNRRLLVTLRDIPGLEEATGLQLAHLLYHWGPPPGWQTPTWIKVAPGAQAAKWQECLTGGYICVGWDEVGDLTAFETEEDFREAFADAYDYNGNKSMITKKARELWRLLELRPGDRIVANKGTSEVVGIGTVTRHGVRVAP